MLWVFLKFREPPAFRMAIMSSSRGSSEGAVLGATIRFPDAVRLSPSPAVGAGGGGGAMGGAGGGGGGGIPPAGGAGGAGGAIGAGGAGGGTGAGGGAATSGGDEPRDPPGTGRSCTFWNAGPAGGLTRDGDVRGGDTREGDDLGGDTRLGAMGEGEGALGAGCDRAATSLAAVGAWGTGSSRGAGTELFAGGDTEDRDWSCDGCRNPRTTGAGRAWPR